MYPFWQIMDKVGVAGNSSFWGYWRDDNPVRKLSPQSEFVMVSSYDCADGVLSVLMNDTDQPVTVELKMDEKIFGDASTVVDAESGEAVVHQSCELSPRDFRMLHIIRRTAAAGK